MLLKLRSLLVVIVVSILVLCYFKSSSSSSISSPSTPSRQPSYSPNQEPFYESELPENNVDISHTLPDAHSIHNIHNLERFHSATVTDGDDHFDISEDMTTEGGRGNILVAGGAGYIASHTIVCLIEAGYDITVVDNLINSSDESLNRIRNLICRDPTTNEPLPENRLRFFNVDLCDRAALENVFLEHAKSSSKPFQACIHFAGLKAVGESVQKPLLYYKNNLESTTNLLELMDKYDCTSIVFSSSATVYGSAEVPITEDTLAGLGITNPYGRTKYMIEEILKDYKKAMDLRSVKEPSKPRWSVVNLRYFNPVGAHPSGHIGEDPNGIPNNLMPFVSQVAVGRRPKLTVFGNDYPTPDGTGVRDYIHVMDLAEGHVAAIKFMEQSTGSSESSDGSKYDVYTKGEGFDKYSVFNLGTGKGCSVFDMVKAMEKASGRPIPFEIAPRREGDIAVCYADTTRAREVLKWSASRSLDDMCHDLWTWQSNNPQGYKK